MFTTEERANALNKIEKLLRLANNVAVAPGEKENALEAANKIATKYHFSIVKNENEVPVAPATPKAVETWHSYTIKYFDRKFLDAILYATGYRFYIRGKEIEIEHDGSFDFDSFSKAYAKFFRTYCSFLEEEKVRYSICGWSRSDSITLKDIVCSGLVSGIQGGHHREARIGKFGYEEGMNFRKFRKEAK